MHAPGLLGFGHGLMPKWVRGWSGIGAGGLSVGFSPCL